jgi:hypothetical protein
VRYASGGTLFLYEITELSAEAQVPFLVPSRGDWAAFTPDGRYKLGGDAPGPLFAPEQPEHLGVPADPKDLAALRIDRNTTGTSIGTRSPEHRVRRHDFRQLAMLQVGLRFAQRPGAMFWNSKALVSSSKRAAISPPRVLPAGSHAATCSTVVALALTVKPGGNEPIAERATIEDDADSVLGSPAYMVPEQKRGESVDQRVDAFAIGAMLWSGTMLPACREVAHAIGKRASFTMVDAS